MIYRTCIAGTRQSRVHVGSVQVAEIRSTLSVHMNVKWRYAGVLICNGVCSSSIMMIDVRGDLVDARCAEAQDEYDDEEEEETTSLHELRHDGRDPTIARCMFKNNSVSST